jgi:hypothetical protein
VQAQLELRRARRSDVEFLSNWEGVLHRSVPSTTTPWVECGSTRFPSRCYPTLATASQMIVPEKLSCTCQDCHKSKAFALFRARSCGSLRRWRAFARRRRGLSHTEGRSATVFTARLIKEPSRCRFIPRAFPRHDGSLESIVARVGSSAA